MERGPFMKKGPTLVPSGDTTPERDISLCVVLGSRGAFRCGSGFCVAHCSFAFVVGSLPLTLIFSRSVSIFDVSLVPFATSLAS